ncbi:hypothetical protein SDC9_183362 [bioreactor metagenome]|uniref:Uncharacterized protein n=1 Tax=bioreactor metagenome TaxID=1076179 RepID=A0A645HAW8_9ZZZZ
MLKSMLLDAIRALAEHSGELGALAAKRKLDEANFTGADHNKLIRATEELEELDRLIRKLVREIVIQERLKAALWLIGLTGLAILIINIIGG